MSRSNLDLWVVEMLVNYGRNRLIWEPTIEVSRNRYFALREMERWRRSNPEDKFRVRHYRRVENKR